MEVNATTTTNPSTAVNSAREREEQSVDDERRSGDVRDLDARADPGPSVGKVVDIIA